MKQTAVEWLEEQMKTWGNLPIWMRDDIVKKAKEMEKEQIMDSYYDGLRNIKKHNTIPIYCTLREEVERFGEQYYNETYKSE
jgi:hypothetical protein